MKFFLLLFICLSSFAKGKVIFDLDEYYQYISNKKLSFDNRFYKASKLKVDFEAYIISSKKIINSYKTSRYQTLINYPFITNLFWLLMDIDVKNVKFAFKDQDTAKNIDLVYDKFKFDNLKSFYKEKLKLKDKNVELLIKAALYKKFRTFQKSSYYEIERVFSDQELLNLVIEYRDFHLRFITQLND
ncbi:MAG: hypothetical protein N4A33_00105 [Bacteriovoracaceae bacterium]|jgi:hypothetical protein|nr:hypothetical protein [Bacteriovoracaceae bacterium]